MNELNGTDKLKGILTFAAYNFLKQQRRECYGMLEGYRELACAILYQAYLDMELKGRRGGFNFRCRQDALAFLDSKWFEQLCLELDLNEYVIRRSLAYDLQRKRTAGDG